MESIVRAASWLKPYRTRVSAALFIGLLVVSVNVLVPLQTQRVIDDGINAGDRGVVLTTVLRLVLLVIGALSLQLAATLISVRVAFRFARDVRRDLHDQIQRLSFRNLDELTTGGLIVRLTTDVGQLQQLVMFSLGFLVQAPLVLVGALIGMLTIRPDLATVLLVIVPVVISMTLVITIRGRKMFEEVQERMDRLNAVLRENLAGARVVKAFVRADQEADRFAVVNHDVAERATDVNQLLALLAPSLMGIINLGTVAVIWFGGGQVIDQRLLSGEFIAFINYLAMASMPLMIFAFVQPLLAAGAASANRIIQIIDAIPAVTPPSDPHHVTVDELHGDIRFEGVGFAYSTGEDVLHDVDLHIPAGETVAVLGATGAGKTTLVNLIARFHDPTRGRVLLDGHDLRDLPRDVVHRAVSVSLQQALLFSGTIAENLRWGDADADLERLVAAADAAAADEFVQLLEDGYDSRVEQNGQNLSGGQRQRLAIARAVIADAPVLVLDDSTSAVDVTTEARIQDALTERRAGRTTILVAQRVSTALAADRIVLLADGTVAGCGTHDELLASSALYREILVSQLGEAAVRA